MGRVDGATITIALVRRHGMQTPDPVVIGTIVMPIGEELPFEASWTEREQRHLAMP